MSEPKYLALSECRSRHVYRVKARCFELAVFDGKDGFMGIRHKFGSRYLFTEYHWDNPHHASCQPLEAIGSLPDTLVVDEDSDTLFAYLDELQLRLGFTKVM